MNLVLVSMPWAAVETPSLALGILRRKVETECPGWSVSERYANLDWLDETSAGGALTLDEYRAIAANVWSGAGEWVFSSALHGTPEWRVEEFRASLMPESRASFGSLLALHRLAPAFAARIAAEIAALDPDLVGFTSTFMQSAPSLAVAKLVKQLSPRTKIVLGGANCDGAQGEALHRAYPFLDYVVRGEGERAFPLLLAALRDGVADLAPIESLSWRAADGTRHTNPAAGLMPMTAIVEPNFDGYFAHYATLSIAAQLDPSLVLESARGCWWGEKHHCTFCGLNGSGMAFRAKRPEAFMATLEAMVRRHQVLDVIMVDNIIDSRYFTTVLPQLAARDWDVHLHYEVKANLTGEQVEALRAAGVYHIQPGIESLNSSVLKLMDKGVSGPQNVRLLRDSQTSGLTVAWNLLYGFPGETADEYEAMIAQTPRLVHLQPPTGGNRISLQRFSPHFDNPALGFQTRRALPFYAIVFDLADDLIQDLAYIFQSEARGIGGATEERLMASIAGWHADHARSSLVASVCDGDVIVADRRAGFAERTHRFEHGWRTAALEALQRPQSLGSLRRAVDDAHAAVDDVAFDAFVRELDEAGLIFADAGHYVWLPTGFDPLSFPSEAETSRAA